MKFLHYFFTSSTECLQTLLPFVLVELGSVSWTHYSSPPPLLQVLSKVCPAYSSPPSAFFSLISYNPKRNIVLFFPIPLQSFSINIWHACTQRETTSLFSFTLSIFLCCSIMVIVIMGYSLVQCLYYLTFFYLRQMLAKQGNSTQLQCLFKCSAFIIIW